MNCIFVVIILNGFQLRYTELILEEPLDSLVFVTSHGDI